jgi:hypothetical protein
LRIRTFAEQQLLRPSQPLLRKVRFPSLERVNRSRRDAQLARDLPARSLNIAFHEEPSNGLLLCFRRWRRPSLWDPAPRTWGPANENLSKQAELLFREGSLLSLEGIHSIVLDTQLACDLATQSVNMPFHEERAHGGE